MAISEEKLKKIELIGDDEIDFSDIPELDDEFFHHAPIVIRIPDGIKITLEPEVWHALASSKEGLSYHVKQIKSALQQYRSKKIA